MPRDGTKTRRRILEAANKLFYAEGIRASGVDAIAEKAGVTKRTLYYHFKSKDDLMEAYLSSRDQPNLAAFQNWFRDAGGSAVDGTNAVFDGIARAARHPKWRGCGFLRTAGELANLPGHPAIKASSRHKKRVEDWLAQEYRSAGLANASTLARQIAILIDGCFSVMLVHRESAYVEAAKEAAAVLVQASLPVKRP